MNEIQNNTADTLAPHELVAGRRYRYVNNETKPPPGNEFVVLIKTIHNNADHNKPVISAHIMWIDQNGEPIQNHTTQSKHVTLTFTRDEIDQHIFIEITDKPTHTWVPAYQRQNGKHIPGHWRSNRTQKRKG
jgi:hypothetical protein